MNRIPLTQGQVALVDDEDFERLGHLKWSAQWDPKMKSFYAMRSVQKNKKQTRLLLHREVLGASGPTTKIDHKNHNTLDCQRHNLRACTHSQNMMNRKGSIVKSRTGIRGIYWAKDRKMWRAEIQVSLKRKLLGSFRNKQNAAAAYAVANRKYFGEFGGGL